MLSQYPLINSFLALRQVPTAAVLVEKVVLASAVAATCRDKMWLDYPDKVLIAACLEDGHTWLINSFKKLVGCSVKLIGLTTRKECFLVCLKARAASSEDSFASLTWEDKPLLRFEVVFFANMSMTTPNIGGLGGYNKGFCGNHDDLYCRANSTKGAPA